jgi:hypothetical protein
MMMIEAGFFVLIEEAEKVLRATRGILDVAWLTPEMRQKVLELEAQAEARRSGPGRYYNEGVCQVLSRQDVCVVLNNNDFRHASDPCLLWVAGGVVIGEEIADPRRLEALRGARDVTLIGRNFALYLDKMEEVLGEEPKFVVQGLPFPELETISGIKDILSASPLGSADLYLKGLFKWDIRDTSLGTILIGFNVD